MAADEPPYLTVGTDVSAKYKGAFCEAKIKKVNRVVKCKVTFKNNLGSAMIPDDQIRGSLRIGADVEAKHPDKNQFCDAVINKLQDYSQYTVVFDDGDETTLRRTSLCLKSGRHFAESPTLDQFPLTNPEHFGTPVIGAGKSKRKRRSTMNSASLDYESSDEELIPKKIKAVRGKERDPDPGKVVCVDFGDRRKKDNWYPGLIVANPVQSNAKISRDEYLIRSFKDGKYYQVPKRDTREFTKDCIQRVDNNTLRTAVEKALLYYEKEELPPHWDKALFMGLELPSADEESHDSDSDSSDDEPSEEKDRFVAQLYKFMDERGTPINKAPTVGNRDLNLYKLFKVMHKMGGYNKVTNQNKWKVVYLKMGLPSSNSAGSNQIKLAYKRYLHSFEDFYRKLGCTMVTNSRSTRGRHRSDRNFIVTRTRDRDTASPKGKNSNKDAKEKILQDKKSDDKTKLAEKKEGKSDDVSKSEEKTKTPDKKKPDRFRSDEKDDKLKRDEKPRMIRSQSLNKDKKDSISKEDDKKGAKPDKARTREDARKEKNESPEKKGTRSSFKIELERKEREENEKKEALKDRKEKTAKDKDKKDEKPVKESKDDKLKDKKEDKNIKDNKKNEKWLKEKRVDEKVIKDRKEKIVRDKREDKPVRDKRESLKERKDEKVIKCKIEERLDKILPDDKLPLKNKKDRFVKEKRDEKFVRARREDKSPISESVKKTTEDLDTKCTKDEKEEQEKNLKDQEIKKEDNSMKESPSCAFLRERRDGTTIGDYSDYCDEVLDLDANDSKEELSRELDNDGFERRGPGSRSKMNDNDEPPNKGKRRSFKLDERDEKESLHDMTDSDDGSFTHDSERTDVKGMKQGEIEIGDRVKVKYGRGRMQKVYEAKVLKIEMDGPDKRYYVHYAGWNMRYDEWVRKNYIVANMSECNRFARKQKQELIGKNPSTSNNMKKLDRGRPPGAFSNTKPARKNSTSSTNSSISCPRTTRSDKKGLQICPFSSGLEPKRRTRKKSGVSTGLTDTSQDSDSDGEDPLAMDMDDDDVEDADVEDNAQGQAESSFKEELFSDDEEKEKQEDMKRGDITELEKAICVEETTNDVKDSFVNTMIKTEDIKKEKSEDQEVNLILASTDNSLKKELEGGLGKVRTMQEDHCKALVNTENVTIKSTAAVLRKPELSFEMKCQPLDQPATPIVNKTAPTDNFRSEPKPTSSMSSFVPVSELKEDKQLTSKPSSTNTSNVTDFPPKKPYLSVMPSPTLERNLTFAGLHDLIQKTPFEKISNTLSNVSSVKKNTSEKAVPETGIQSLIKCRKSSSVFFPTDLGNTLKATPVSKSDEKVSKVVSCITKSPIVVKEHQVESKTEEKPKTSCVIQESDKPNIKEDDMNKNLLENKQIPVQEPVIVKQDLHPVDSSSKSSILIPKKFEEHKKESKPQDTFDYLVQSSTSSISQDHCKISEVKDNMFPLSFSHNPMLETFVLEQQRPYNKPVSLSSENISTLKTKQSETVDLSKTIPGILERLKKDVVADVKFSDSPPPRKEELNFDFLRGSQETTKSLSRSDSSNSLRICEDMSDTNDSNNDPRDLIIPEKTEVSPHILTPMTEILDKLITSDTLIVKENNPEVSKKSEDCVSLPIMESSQENSEPLEENKSHAQQTSVITVAASAALTVLSAVSLPESKDISPLSETLIAATKESTSSVEDLALDSTDFDMKQDEQLVMDKLEPSSQSDVLVENKSVVEDKTKVLPKEVLEVSKPEKYELEPVKSNVSQENKDALFDDLLKIKCASSNFSQDSVIKRVPEATKTMIQSNSQEILTSVENTEVVVEDKINDLTEFESQPLLPNEDDIAEPIKNMNMEQSGTFDKLKSECQDPFPVSEVKTLGDDAALPEEDSFLSTVSKKEGKRKKSKLSKLEKRLGSSDCLDKDENKEVKVKDGKSKSKKRARFENDDLEKGKDSDMKTKSKKIKKNKNKKRFSKHDDQFSDYSRKLDLKDDENKDGPFEKIKKKEKRKGDKKFMKGGIKCDDMTDIKGESTKKKKGKKNRDKFGNEKKDFLEKKGRKKKKLHPEDNLDSDSEKDFVPKMMDKKKKKDRKKFKAKDGSSSDDASDSKLFKDQSKTLSGTGALPRQDSKSDDPDMSFLLCEEKVPASPVGINNLPEDTSGSSSMEENNNVQPNSEAEQVSSMNRYRVENLEPLDAMNKHNLDTCAVLDNTPPTTPSSTESLLSSSPTHERDAFALNYPESTQSGRESVDGESDVFHCNPNRTVIRESEEYNAATTLAFQVCKSVSEKPKEVPHPFLKRQKSETEDHSPSKRKKKSKRMRRSSESAKSPRHKSSLPRMSKVESCCEDSSGASPTTSNSPPYGNTSTISTSFSRSSPHRLSSITDAASRYSFFVPLYDKDPEKRIAILQDKMTQLRKEYMALKAEVAMIDRRRKKARKKVRDTAGSSATNPSVQSEDGQSCS